MQKRDYSTLNILCLILAIISVPFFCIYLVGGIFALASIVLGIIYLIKGKNKKYLSIIGISISSVIILLCCLFLFVTAMDKISEINNNIRNEKSEYQTENSTEIETETQTQTEIKTETETQKQTAEQTTITTNEEDTKKDSSNPLSSILCFLSFMAFMIFIVYIMEKNPIDNTLKCPKCKSTQLVPIDTDKKFSLGKAVVGNTIGGIVGGIPGAIIGAGTGIKGKNGKTKFYCQNCGNVFEKKI